MFLDDDGSAADLDVTDVSTNDSPAFDWDAFYRDYGDVGGAYDESTSPTEDDVIEAVSTGSSSNPMLSRIFSSLGAQGKDFIKKYLFDSATGKVNLAGVGSLGMALYGLANRDKQGGYSRPVPKLDMVREQIQYNDPNRRPGEGGRQYFTDPRFAAQGNAEALTAAKAASTEQGQGILAAYQPRPVEAPNPYAGRMNLAFSRPGGVATSAAQTSEAEPIRQEQQMTTQGLPGALRSASSIAPVTQTIPPSSVASTPPASSVISNPAEKAMQERLNAPIRPRNPQDFGGPGMIDNPEYLAMGARGIDQPMDMRYVPRYVSRAPSESFDPSKLPTGLAAGGLADAGRYLQGKTDGMADEIPSSIDGEQPAALSHGEFVIPADVVSHLGNGNSDAGAQKLYEMMDRIRQARTGTTEQGKEINPDEFTMGGLASAYAGGGSVKRFNAGGPSAANPTATGAGVPHDVSRTSTLSPWVGDYVTDALGQGAALAKAPYQAYQGPLTAGASDLQQQAFAGASDIAGAGFTPTQFSGGLFDTKAAQSYMNPYIQSALDPQLRELQRQSDIQRTQDAGRLTKAGAFGGSRQAIMESEGRRNLLDKQAGVLGQGYATAYDKAMAQFNADQGRSMDAQKATEASRQYGADFGLKSVNQLADLGATQRGITSEGLAADKAQFEEQRDFAYSMPKYQLGLLSGLPIAANTTSVDQDAMGRFDSTLSGLAARYKTLEDTLAKLGQAPVN
jgi:hypothetical protein